MIRDTGENWNQLQDAYGSASKIPELLGKLSTKPAEVWEELWSRLCHQGDVYSASFAATPYIVKIVIENKTLDFNFYLLPLSIELGRLEKEVEVPPELLGRHLSALSELTQFTFVLDQAALDESMKRCITALRLFSEGKIDEVRDLIG